MKSYYIILNNGVLIEFQSKPDKLPIFDKTNDEIMFCYEHRCVAHCSGRKVSITKVRVSDVSAHNVSKEAHIVP